MGIRASDPRRYRSRRQRAGVLHPPASFEDTNDLSGLIADFYRRQYDTRGIDADRLLGESFVLVQPWWALRTGAVPYWTTFNGLSDAESLDRYLDGVEPYDDINLIPLSNSVRAAGQASIERWRAVLSRAERQGRFLGVDPAKYPADLGMYYRYSTELPEAIPDRHLLPCSVSIDDFKMFLDSSHCKYPIEWIEE